LINKGLIAMVELLLFLLLLPFIIIFLSTIITIIIVSRLKKYPKEEKIITTLPFAEPEYKEEQENK